MTTHALAVDIGGTFTDIVLAAPDGTIALHKRLTDREQPDRGVIAGVREILERNAVSPADVSRVVHGTTLATNTVLERTGPPVAFVTTAGFGDLLHIGRDARVEDDRYDLFFEAAEPPLPRSMVFEIDERIGAQGEVVRPLDEAQAASVVEQVVAAKPSAVALCFLHCYNNATHEQRVAKLLRDALPADVHVVCSSDVLPELREYERATTTLVSAYVAPVMAGYLARLQQGLRELGVHAPLQIMESSGGVMAAQVAAARAVATIESGGAAGVVAAAGIAQRDDLPLVLSFDMGGTTAKAGVVHDGQPRLTRDLHVGGKGTYGGRRAGTGIPVRIPVIDLAEVGVGGGSIAWLAEDGALRVGPRSAGSEPGPACYGQGGTEPTVTDANLVLGYLDPANFAGGAMQLDADAGIRSVREHLAEPLGVDLPTAAWAVYGLVNANMASAIHVVTVQRGLDPREHVPIAFGGAGPMHMVGVADHFDIDLVVAPDGAGVTSALGMLATDLAAERSVTFVAPIDTVDPADVGVRFDELIAAGLRQMGFDEPPDGLVVERLADVRYRGQSHALTVPVADGPIDAGALAGLVPEFRALFSREFGVDRDAATELAALRVRLRQPVARVADPVVGTRDVGDARTGTRPAYFGPASDNEYVDTSVYRRDRLAPGDELDGPAIVEGAVDTVVVPPNWSARVDDRRGLHLVRRR